MVERRKEKPGKMDLASGSSRLGWGRGEVGGKLPAGLGGWSASACATHLALVGGRGGRGYSSSSHRSKSKAVTVLSALWSGTGPGLGHWAHTPAKG